VAGVIGISDNSIVHGIAATHRATRERAGVVDDDDDPDFPDEGTRQHHQQYALNAFSYQKGVDVGQAGIQ
jgi:hypothetical protein